MPEVTSISATIPALPPLPVDESLALSVVIVSFNTRETLRRCLELLQSELDRISPDRISPDRLNPDRLTGVSSEILVVDNASTDGSAEMVQHSFPAVRLLRSPVNLGFGGANNLALGASRGHTLLLLNSDAFLTQPVLPELLPLFHADPSIGILGIAQLSRDGSLQPSARRFHTLWRDACMMTGLAERFPRNRLWAAVFGGLDRKWANTAHPVDADWLPGAFLLLRRSLLDTIGLFDERFFLYLEEVDLCHRARRAGWRIVYRPEFSVLHLGGESAGSVNAALDAPPSHQVVLWRMRSTLLYYRKWRSRETRAAAALELALYRLRWLRNRWSSSPARRQRARHALQLIALMRQAWRDTRGGRLSPPRPW